MRSAAICGLREFRLEASLCDEVVEVIEVFAVEPYRILRNDIAPKRGFGGPENAFGAAWAR
jgi:hypothetical protein